MVFHSSLTRVFIYAWNKETIFSSDTLNDCRKNFIFIFGIIITYDQ